MRHRPTSLAALAVALAGSYGNSAPRRSHDAPQNTQRSTVNRRDGEPYQQSERRKARRRRQMMKGLITRTPADD